MIRANLHIKTFSSGWREKMINFIIQLPASEKFRGFFEWISVWFNEHIEHNEVTNG